jgi:hypothetical protein
MKRPAELMDWDRTPEGAKYKRLLDDLFERPMSSKRIPSPYTQAPRPIKDESAAPVAFVCFAMMGGLLTFIGIATVVRWIAEAVR